MQPKKNWFLRKKDGSEYGPVSLNDLLRWSAQCRIVAGNAVSMDREEWTPVEEIAELEMHWIAHRADGKEYGPFALAAVQELFAHNVLPADAILVNRLTGENKPLADVIELPESTVETPDNIEKPVEIEEVENQTKEHGGAAAEAAEPNEPTPGEQQPTANNLCPTTNASTPDAPETGTDTNETETALNNPLERENEALGNQVEQLRQELHDAQSETAESGEAYLAKIAILEKKLQNAQQAASDATARLEALKAEREQSQLQVGGDLADLRKQTAFMKKNIAALHAELDASKRQSAFRARIVLALGTLLTIIAALLIIRAAGGCRRRDDIGATAPQARSETTTAGESLPPDGVAAAAGSTAWPSLRIDGLRVERKQDHLLIRFDEGAFGSLTTLTPAAAGQLKTLVERLRPDLPAYRLVVEGHTDNIPMRATTAFADNAALAAARAETGAAYLKREGANAIAATSAGTPPYPNDTPENRRRNRTLVIRLYQ